MISLTEAADKQVSSICNDMKCDAVSLGIKGGGCAGFEYEWKTIGAEEIAKDDFVIDCETGMFVVDSMSTVFLAGSIIDYKKDIIGSMFEIKNPNAQSSCGCGVSVNFDMDKLATEA